MKKMKWVLALAVGGCLIATSAMAVIENSHHDMQTWRNDANIELCYPCHGATDANPSGGNYGNVGALCITRCHGGTTGFAGLAGSDRPIPTYPATADLANAYQAHGTTTSIDAVNINLAHGLTASSLVTPINGASQVSFASVGTNLPYGGDSEIECTTCHSVHNNDNAPFLHRPLFTGGPTATESFCEACHTARGTGAGDWAGGSVGAPDGEHPVNITLDVDATVVRSGSSNYGDSTVSRVGRYIEIDIYGGAANRIFDVSSPNTAAALSGTTGDTGNKYITGGKVSTWIQAADNAIMGCYTCHGVHQPSNASGSPDNLVLRPTANGEESPLCAGCHGNDTGGTDDPNPGGTPWYHPVGNGANPALTNPSADIWTYEASTPATFTFPVDLGGIINYTNIAVTGSNGGVGIDMTTGAGNAQGRPRCTSCHDIHGGIGGSMALADIDGVVDGTLNSTNYANICEVCHSNTGGADLPDDQGDAQASAEPANSHHITNTNTNYSVNETYPGTWTDGDGNVLSLDAPSWGADLSDGLQCSDCHSFNGTAHNW